jgi:hypothetical protein
MKLPDVEGAVLVEAKFTAYLLDETHQEGRGKALFFKRFGSSVTEWGLLAHALVEHARAHNVVKMEQTRFGTRYVVEGELETPVGRRLLVRVVWFVPDGESVPYLVTAYPMEGTDDQGT